MKPFRLLALMLICALAWPVAAQVRVLVGSTSRFAPDAGGQGYVYDVVRAMAKQIGYTKEFELMPWERARMIAENSNDVLIIPVVRTPKREERFLWLALLLEDDFVLVSQKPIEMAEVARRNICVLRGSAVLDVTTRLGYTHLDFSVDEEHALHRLLAGNCDIWIVGRRPAKVLIEQAGLQFADFHVSPPLQHFSMYLAASRNFDAGEAKRWQAAYEVISADGTLAAIRHRYQIE